MKRLIISLALGAAMVGCDEAPKPGTVITDDPFDEPLAGLDDEALDVFARGDKLFGTAFRTGDGLGPLYIRTSCAACHEEAGKGPGAVQKFQVVESASRALAKDAPEMAYGSTERPYFTAGASRPLLAPERVTAGFELVRSRRVGPSAIGRGYLEAILDSEIERVEAEQARRSDGVRGRINRVTYHSHDAPGVVVSRQQGETGLIGRFGLKARVVSLDDFAADAFQGDMGLTSPLRPEEMPNPDGVLDDRRPGPDLEAATVITVGAYVRTIAIPTRQTSPAGAALFERAACNACHVPTMRTRPDYPVRVLAGIDAPVYTDLLLHDMGDALADSLTDENAGPREWRTAPLIAMRFQRSYLHDGRAQTIEEAILHHEGPGSQANASVEKFKALSEAERAALVAFVLGL